MTTYTIGYERDDGDFAVVATLNNNDELFTPAQFEALKESLLVQMYSKLPGFEPLLICLEHQCAPDYINPNEGE